MSEFEQRAIEYLKGIAFFENERAMGRKLLQQTIDLAAFPTDLLHFVHLSPPIYNAGTRRFEFQRTPNKIIGIAASAFTLGQEIAFASLTSADGQGLIVPDGMIWRVLGGRYNFSVNATIDFKDSVKGVVFEHMAVQANIVQPFAIPGNGALIRSGQSIAVKASAAGNLDAVLYIAEEGDTVGRGAV